MKKTYLFAIAALLLVGALLLTITYSDAKCTPTKIGKAVGTQTIGDIKVLWPATNGKQDIVVMDVDGSEVTMQLVEKTLFAGKDPVTVIEIEADQDIINLEPYKYTTYAIPAVEESVTTDTIWLYTPNGNNIRSYGMSKDGKWTGVFYRNPETEETLFFGEVSSSKQFLALINGYTLQSNYQGSRYHKIQLDLVETRWYLDGFHGEYAKYGPKAETADTTELQILCCTQDSQCNTGETCTSGACRSNKLRTAFDYVIGNYYL
ncbi:MAG: hypothetical protein ABIJ18_00755 [archaeon]